MRVVGRRAASVVASEDDKRVLADSLVFQRRQDAADGGVQVHHTSGIVSTDFAGDRLGDFVQPRLRFVDRQMHGRKWHI